MQTLVAVNDNPGCAAENPKDRGSLDELRRDLTEMMAQARARLAELEASAGEELGLDERTWVASLADGLHMVQERLESAPRPARPLRQELASDPGDRGRFKVLCVGADAMARARVARLVSPYFTLRFASDAGVAARLAVEERPDLLLADLSGASLERVALVSRLRTEEELAEMPVIALSDRGDAEAKLQAFESGAYDFISKALLESELVVRVRNALVRSQALRQERLIRETDDLTGLPNRRRFRAYFSAAVRACKASHSELTVVMVDMDGLKPINDRFGHAAGDRALRALAEALEQCKRGSDLAARLGGDEFVVVLPHTGRDGACNFISRVEDALRRPVMRMADGDPMRLGASFGVASLGERGWEERTEELLERADVALYLQKAEHHAVRPAEARDDVRANVSATL